MSPQPVPSATERVLGECVRRVRDGLDPGCVGLTTPQQAAAVGRMIGADPRWWTTARITTWRLEQARDLAGLLRPPTGSWPWISPLGSTEIAHTGLGLCDGLVRDDLIARAAHSPLPGRDAAAARLRQVAATIPEAIRGPAATVLAVLDLAAGRDTTQALDWARGTPDYRLGHLVGELASAGADGARLLDLLGTVPRLTTDPVAAQAPHPTEAADADPTVGDPLVLAATGSEVGAGAQAGARR